MIKEGEQEDQYATKCLTPAIRCPKLNQQSAPNSIPKPPSVTGHLDCLVTCRFCDELWL